ncbi:MAG: hypothetical protein IJD83_01955 [Clostridia bacterium]|nr:hypothetical protein [Clostridia bacterium]
MPLPVAEEGIVYTPQRSTEGKAIYRRRQMSGTARRDEDKFSAENLARSCGSNPIPATKKSLKLLCFKDFFL